VRVDEPVLAAKLLGPGVEEARDVALAQETLRGVAAVGVEAEADETGRPSTIRSVWIATTLAVIAEKSMKTLARSDLIGATISRMAVMRMKACVPPRPCAAVGDLYRVRCSRATCKSRGRSGSPGERRVRFGGVSRSKIMAGSACFT